MIVKINAKCSDLCYYEILNDNGTVIHENDGYVPDFMPGQHFGDYVMLDIDVKTGKILNWTATKTMIMSEINESKKGE